ncbi:metal ABC transporter permease [Aeropyrum pernix]|uniref:metal ABC transporter permease n=1 Tax=Aeropyrum pernix TaxID=56636 RepID=UPI000005DBAA|nr:metal ABC transporter permease [Aeropyrum pernix]
MTPKPEHIAGAAAILLLVLGLALYPSEWVFAVAGAGLAYGSLSPTLYSRRLLFLAGAAPHSALAAASLGAVAAALTGVGGAWISLALGLTLIYAAGYSIYRGVDPDTAAALLAGFTASLGIAGLYLAGRTGASISTLVIGDPLLASRTEALAVLALGVLFLATLLLLGDRIAYIGVDREDAMLSGTRVWAYDLLLYTMIALSTVGLITVVGFILEHVLLLIPGALILPLTRGSRTAALAGGLAGSAAGVGGLILGGLTGIPPAAASGLILMLTYLVVLLHSGVWRSG